MSDKTKYLRLKPSRYAQDAIIRQIYIPRKYENKVTRETVSEDLSITSITKDEIETEIRLSMYSSLDDQRVFDEGRTSNEYRSEFRRDYARIVHSPAFRRLQGKTQLFPCIESDFFRNRLTHSVEVSQIARTIGLKINTEFLKEDDEKINLDLLEIAALAHDIGHPPFGHQGEEALNESMYFYGGFEGNAQTLRLLSKIEKKRHEGLLELEGFDQNGEDRRRGLNLTYRSLAAVLKYDELVSIRQTNEIPTVFPKPLKGYYRTEKDLVEKIKTAVTNGNTNYSKFRTLECWIMDVADDIAYSTFDLEDAFKAGFVKPIDVINLQDSFHEYLADKVTEEFGKEVSSKEILDIISDLLQDVLFGLDAMGGVKGLTEPDLKKREFLFLGLQYAYTYSDYLVENGYIRSDFTSQLIDDAVNSIEFHREDILALSRVSLKEEAKIRVEILKQVAFQTQILSPKLKIAEFRGKEIVKKIFDALIKDPELLPYDFRRIFKAKDIILKGNLKSQEKERRARQIKVHQYRTVCDYIACMTDKYAIELYGRLTSENPETIFKPY